MIKVLFFFFTSAFTELNYTSSGFHNLKYFQVANLGILYLQISFLDFYVQLVPRKHIGRNNKKIREFTLPGKAFILSQAIALS